MILSDLIRYVSTRTGETDQTALVAEIHNELRRMWYTTDIEGSLEEIDVVPGENRVVVLPWYVFQVKAIRRTTGEPVRLYTPRAYYHDFSGRMSDFDCRVLKRQPLMKSMANPGVLKIKLRQPAEVDFIVNVRGPDDFGVSSRESVIFSAGDTEHTTTGSYVDVDTLSKTVAGNVDVEVIDITGDVIGIIPGQLTEVWCQVVQVLDKLTSPTNAPWRTVSVLYKRTPPALTSPYDAIPDEIGLVLQDAVVAARLAMKKDESSQKQATQYRADSRSTSASVAKKADEGKLMPLDLKVSPFQTMYYGKL